MQTIRQFRIFLSSPGDVAQERDDAETVIREINDSGEFSNHFMLKLFRWDDKAVVLPMPATDTPQKSVDVYMTRPSDCDLVVVVFWSRMGTPLVMDAREYHSGTHYEYSEALQGYEQVGKPTVWLYRCAEELLISAKDPKRDEKNRQFDLVEQFFKQFQDTKGRYTGGVNSYPTHDDFKSLFKGQLLTHLRHLRDQPQAEIVSKPDAKPKFIGVPYKGLLALDESDTPIFFGRDAETLEVLSRVDNKRIVTVLGASGSGKSSLVAAGVLPKLRERGWKVIRFVPDEDPFTQLARAMVSQLPELGVKPTDYLSEAAKLAQTLNASSENLVVQLNLTFPGQHVLVFIDQFEELFTLAIKNPKLPDRTIETFLQAIRHPSPYITTLITLRADFYATALTYLAELKQEAYGLTRPSLYSLYEMITRPAELAGLELELGLADRIIDEVGIESGGLALVAYVMEALHLKEQARHDNRLTRADYEAIGGVQGAISQRADEIFNNLSEDAQKSLPRVFYALVEVDDRGTPTRKRANLTDVTRTEPMRELVDAFIKARLLTTNIESKSQTPVVEVTHEALLRNWGRLAKWFDQTQENLRLLSRLRNEAIEWDKAGRAYARWEHERLKRVYWIRDEYKLEFDEVVNAFIEPELDRLLAEFYTRGTPEYRQQVIIDSLAKIGEDAIPTLVEIYSVSGGTGTLLFVGRVDDPSA